MASRSRTGTSPFRTRFSVESLEDRLAPATFTVTNTLDDEAKGSLRWAIGRANATPGADVIKFDIGTGQQTINVASTLKIKDTVTIAGQSQPGFTDTPLIVLTGPGASTAGATGLAIKPAASGSVIRALVINEFEDGIDISADNCVVKGCFIGTNAAGTDPQSNAYGIYIFGGATGNVIGGTSAAARNVISGNLSIGVDIEDVGTSGNLIQGNYIGTDVSGLNAVGNAQEPGGGAAIYIGYGASGNVIGGTAAGAGNVISGNGAGGVDIEGLDSPNPTTSGNKVQGNLIGTNKDGNVVLANTGAGILIRHRAQGNVIGGGSAEARNVIAGNTGDGVVLTDKGTSGNKVKGNFIGTDVTGGVGMGNTNNGVLIEESARDNIIGGTTVGARNVISGNGEDGVAIEGEGTNGNVVQGNFIGLKENGTERLDNAGNGVFIGSVASGNVIGGTVAGVRNVISGNGEHGVLLEAAGPKNKVQGNYIGIDKTGGVSIGNGTTGDGVRIDPDTTQTVIGGTTVDSRNVISGNLGNGVTIQGSLGTTTSENKIKGNYLGTDKTGLAARGNAGYGVFISNASLNVIGGTTAADRNVISGNGADGVTILGQDATDNKILGNYIGTDKTGAVALGNTNNGVSLGLGTHFNSVGGTETGSGNVISGNGAFGVVMFKNDNLDPAVFSNTVQGNKIGTDVAGTVDLGNGNAGVFLTGNANGNTIGGTVAGAGNTIAFNHGDGILIGTIPGVFDIDAGTGNTINRNRIFSNTGQGIDLGPNDGVTPNDALPGDLDTGPNNLQNFPELTSAQIKPAGLKIGGTINTVADTKVRIEFFASPAVLGSGNGKKYLGFVEVTTDASGDATISATLASTGVAAGQLITATATNLSTGDTSEFSATVTVS